MDQLIFASLSHYWYEVGMLKVDRGFYIPDNKEEHITTIRSEAERVINRTLPVCHPSTEVMGVQHYRSYEAFLLGSHSSLVVFKEKPECT